MVSTPTGPSSSSCSRACSTPRGRRPASTPAGRTATCPPGRRSTAPTCIERQVERFAPGFRDRILARHVMNTADLEQYNANYVGGAITGGVTDLGQLFTRPVGARQPVLHAQSRRLHLLRLRPLPAAACTACAATTRPAQRAAPPGLRGCVKMWAMILVVFRSRNRPDGDLEEYARRSKRLHELVAAASRLHLDRELRDSRRRGGVPRALRERRVGEGVARQPRASRDPALGARGLLLLVLGAGERGDSRRTRSTSRNARRRPPPRSSATRAEEVLQQRRGFVGADTAGHRRSGGCCADCGARRTRCRRRPSWDRGAVDARGDARLHHRPGAHRTRLQRRVHRDAVETPATDDAAPRGAAPASPRARWRHRSAPYALPAAARTAPSRTATAPTGTSPRAPAARAACSARRMKRSCGSIATPPRRAAGRSSSPDARQRAWCRRRSARART